jgi:predicted O-linked N-acetylglucosamine transferase (SPINDLY family)
MNLQSPGLSPQDIAAIRAHMQQALQMHHAGRLTEAQTLYQRVLALHPAHLPALQMLGVLMFQTGRQEEGVVLLEKVVDANPIDPAAYNNLGNALRELGRHEAAAACFEKAVTLNPSFVDAWSNWGNALSDLHRHEDALVAYGKALALQPHHANALNNRASTLVALHRCAEALRDYDLSIRLQPQMAETYAHRAAALVGLGRHEEALQSCDVALQLQPTLVKAHWCRVDALRALKRFTALAKTCDTVLALDPDYPYALGMGLSARLYACDWQDYDHRVNAVITAVQQGEKCIDPFSFLPVSDSPADLHACAHLKQQEIPSNLPQLCTTAPYGHQRLRLAYLSADFHDHATAYLMAELFERHDRQHFEVFAYSFGPNASSPMRERLIASFEHFHDVTVWTDEQVAHHMRQQEIDIAVDLKGYTGQSRTQIFAFRPAPIQVNYLGYPGTMAAGFMDYLIGDAVVTPLEHDAFYTEKIVRLPGSYQVNDSQRRIASEAPTREECGLSAAGFVFCCFNNNYKINPPVFDIWMRLLQRVPGSVMWLLQDNASAAANLQAQAQARGVGPHRLVFAARSPLPQHLARHCHADLFLDTVPCNAHTTTSDALWAGLPVLTCQGNTFAGRVAASLLHAAGMPELITYSLEAYEARAFQLASQPAELQAIKDRLRAQRGTCSLFDADAFRLKLESAYQGMYRERWHLTAG